MYNVFGFCHTSATKLRIWTIIIQGAQIGSTIYQLALPAYTTCDHLQLSFSVASSTSRLHLPYHGCTSRRLLYIHTLRWRRDQITRSFPWRERCHWIRLQTSVIFLLKIDPIRTYSTSPTHHHSQSTKAITTFTKLPLFWWNNLSTRWCGRKSKKSSSMLDVCPPIASRWNGSERLHSWSFLSRALNRTQHTDEHSKIEHASPWLQTQLP